MAVKKATIYIIIGILAIGYNVFKIVKRASQPSIDLTNKNIPYKLGFMVGSYGLLIFGILIVLFTVIALKRKQSAPST